MIRSTRVNHGHHFVSSVQYIYIYIYVQMPPRSMLLSCPEQLLGSTIQSLELNEGKTSTVGGYTVVSVERAAYIRTRVLLPISPFELHERLLQYSTVQRRGR